MIIEHLAIIFKDLIKTVFAFDDKVIEQEKLASIRVADRPDLAHYQCNDSFKIVKIIAKENLQTKKNLQTSSKTQLKTPREVALYLVEHLKDKHKDYIFSVAGAGFINIKLSNSNLIKQLKNVLQTKDLGFFHTQKPEKIIIDYGGPNIAKPLHVGHLRSAIIGQTLKNILQKVGHETISDVHFGDYGLQMGQLMIAIEDYFPKYLHAFVQEDKELELSNKPSLDDLEKIYPKISSACKNDKVLAKRAALATKSLQGGNDLYKKIWHEISLLSKQAIKKQYDNLGVHFDLWLGESDVAHYIDELEELFKQKNILVTDDGAKIIRLDDYDMPPLIYKKSNGAALYGTTDLCTIYNRVHKNNPQRIIYICDKRQSLHYRQFFQVASMANIFKHDRLEYIPFGTMNGKDGKPFKTRQGGVLRLESLTEQIYQKAKTIMKASDENKVSSIDANSSALSKGNDSLDNVDTAKQVGIAALKFADLINPRQSDYIFDIEKFISFEGKTGPYILYACVRINSILNKTGFDYKKAKDKEIVNIKLSKVMEDVIILLLNFSQQSYKSYSLREPYIIAEHAYLLAHNFSKLYHEEKILTANDETKNMLLLISYGVYKQISLIFSLMGIIIPKKM